MSAGPLPGTAEAAGPSSSQRLGRMLHAGILLGTVLLLGGAVLGGIRGDLQRGLGLSPPVLRDVAAGLARLETAALLRAGLLVLILTPILRVAAVGFLLGRRGDRLAVACAVGVLALLVAASFLGSGHL